jgi:hypothetical protein
VRAWAQERDGILFAALGGGASVEAGALLIAPGFFKADDLRRRALSCLEALGLQLEVRLTQPEGGAAPQAGSGPRATLKDVYDIFGAGGGAAGRKPPATKQ